MSVLISAIYCFYKLEKEHAINIKRQIWLYDKGNYDTLRKEVTATNRNELKDDNIDIYCSNVSNRITSLADK